jgi:hypothetical protein
MIRAAVAAALRKIRVPETRWANVESYNPTTEATVVRPDGTGDPIPVTNATGVGFAVGQRVLLLYTPPQGCHVVGYRPAPPIEYAPTFTGLDVDDGDVFGEFVYGEQGMVDFAVVAEVGAAGSASATIYVSLPVEGSSLSTATPWLITARATSGSNRWVGEAAFDPTVSSETVGSFGGDGAAPWGATVPFTWGPGDLLRVTGRYPRRLPVQDVTS